MALCVNFHQRWLTVVSTVGLKHTYYTSDQYQFADFEQGLDLDKFITDTLPFSRINEAFDKLQAGECLRIALDYSK